MKRLLLYLLTMMVTVVAMAKDVTPEEALQKATQFVAKRHAARVQRAPGTDITTPKLELTAQVSGLYLFNVSNAGGYVIVSPDDCTEAILGYSDSGNIDPQHMPENMRAWLQGYADQIAWARQNNIQASNAPRKTDREAVAPLLTTLWGQDKAYYDLCVFNGDQCVTGCVATAMAQVMYYHRWPSATANEIPAFTTASNGYQVPAIPAGSAFDWNNMLQYYDVYVPEGSQYGYYAPAHTEEQALAVAQLMHYCGAAVMMNYGTGSSGAQDTEIPYALTHYFNYNANTTVLLERDSYETDDWDEIIYHEVSNGRPVIYGGLTSNNEGHEFVCDGYNNTDGSYHINWGWMGLSNGYFLLSALDPDAQGTGGSSSNSGYKYDQTAVIGIQKPSDTGEVSSAVGNATGISLQLLNLTFSENPTIEGHDVIISATIKNNSVNNYNSWFSIWKSDISGSISVWSFSVNSGETKVYTQTVTPTNGQRYKIGYVGSDNYLHSLCTTEPVTVYPENISKTMNQYGWATLSSAYPLDFSETGLTPYIVTGSEGKLVEKTELTKAPGGIGLLIKGEPNQIFTIPVTLEATDDVTGNLMVPVIDAEVTVTKSVDATKENYVLSVDNEGEKAVFARVNADDATVEVGKAYLTLPASTDNAPFLSFDDEEGTTGIRSLTPTLSQEEGVYTLDGRKLNGMPTAKGVYIVNGQKVVIK